VNAGSPLHTAQPLVEKYDVPGPRYTSYPTVAYWGHPPAAGEWLQHLDRALGPQAAGEPHGVALYVHLPFCRALCTFCGCNTRITRTHSGVRPYVQAVLEEFRLYRDGLGRASLELGELYLGGGTPTFLDVDELELLLGGLGPHLAPRTGASLTAEIDPRVTSREQLAVLARHGFRCLSLGVQDFDPAVQDIVNRVQSEAQVAGVTCEARELGYRSIGFDLIYGLPLQSLASIDLTMAALERLRPDRIALYGYAHVPWIRPGQRRFTEADLPEGAARRALYLRSRQWLAQLGYREIGMDQFALPGDALSQAAAAGSLHRNFMGYTTAATRALIGLGASAIGDAGAAYAQNEKELQPYQERVARGEFPLQRGHLLDAEDRILRQHILRLMTRFATSWHAAGEQTPYLAQVPGRLAQMQQDGLVELGQAQVRVTEAGRSCLRNICMAFDARLARRSPERPLLRTV